MEKLESIIAWGAFTAMATVVLLAPWCFGAWEAWWFWPFLVIISASAALFGVQLLLKSAHHETRTTSSGRRSSGSGVRRRRVNGADNGNRKRLILASLLACAPFLIYAVLRLMRTTVLADAQRSVLLFVTPVILGIQVAYGIDRRRRRLLHRLILFDLLLLGLYGILNHLITGSRLVLWRPGFPQYFMADRASGSYFCPDHYAGIMEIALCLALGILCARASARRWRFAAALVSIVAITGVFLSKSRGGGMTVLVILAATWIWGLIQHPPAFRWTLRAVAITVAVAGILVTVMTGNAYFKRFGSWFGWEQARTQPFPEAIQTVSQAVQRSSRWVMLSGAMRAWVESPVTGIGPGMHQNIWPHVAASGDGSVAKKIWPTRINNRNYSYEVHNDWVQLLEEYGLVGLVLMLGATGMIGRALLIGIARSKATDDSAPSGDSDTGFALTLTAWLALVGIAFHSLGDFNLQMPATTWLFAIVIALGVRATAQRSHRSSSADSGTGV